MRMFGSFLVGMIVMALVNALLDILGIIILSAEQQFYAAVLMFIALLWLGVSAKVEQPKAEQQEES